MCGQNKDKRAAANERFGATAAGRAALKGSAVMPPLRQAAPPLAASGGQRRCILEAKKYRALRTTK